MTHATALPIRCPPSITPLGDRALLVTLGKQIDEATHRQVRTAWLALEASHIPSIIEVVPAYTTLAIHYDPLLALQAGATAEGIVPWLSQQVIAALEMNDSWAAAEKGNAARMIELPVCYESECAPDLEAVAAHTRLSREEVIRLHSSAEYRVHLVGFAPGFAYLGGLSECLATPRLATPRRAVPRGSVGIAGNQTGVYPLPTPGGWQLIGRTPLRLFTPETEPPVLLRMGDDVRIRRVSLDEYKQLEDAL